MIEGGVLRGEVWGAGGEVRSCVCVLCSGEVSPTGGASPGSSFPVPPVLGICALLSLYLWLSLLNSYL